MSKRRILGIARAVSALAHTDDSEWNKDGIPSIIDGQRMHSIFGRHEGMTNCTSCNALIIPGRETKLCCNNGTQILPKHHNPPMDEEAKQIFNDSQFPAWSWRLNNNAAPVVIGTYSQEGRGPKTIEKAQHVYL